MRFQAEEALQIYIEESLEHLADIEKDLLAIEKSGVDINADQINKVFRSAHSIKGGAGLLGYNKIKELAHKMENLLGMFRDRSLTPGASLINILLKAADTLKELIQDPDESNDRDITGLLATLIAAAEYGALPVDRTGPDRRQPPADRPQAGPGADAQQESPAPRLRKKQASSPAPARSPVPTVEKKCSSLSGRPGESEAVQVYIDESIEHLTDIENDILVIEQQNDETDEDLVNKVFRAAHSIKGGAGFLGFNNIKNLAHKAENLLGRIRSRQLLPNEEVVTALLKGTDTLRSLINDIYNSDDKDISEIVRMLTAAAMDSPGTPPVREGTRRPPTQEDESIRSGTDRGTPAAASVNEKSPISVIAPVSSLRVKTSLLDSLMTLAGELVLSRNQLMRAVSSRDGRHVDAVSQHIDLITSELQEAIMNTRMQPIGNVFNKFPRLIRDLATEFGKEVELTLAGEDVELDKTIIEAINDPLTHLIRNSIDHGIEKPAERQRKNKPAKGRIHLSAMHEAGHVIIEISDDGRGLDGEQLTRKAIDLGLLDRNKARLMSAKEKLFLIMKPGFSTAEVITDVSGRGVGMDVVKTNFDRLSGQIDINSQVDVGTTITIKLPLTLAIITSQVVRNQGERYAIPQVNLVELLRIPASQVKQRIERVGNADVVRLRDSLLPIVKLADVLGMDEFYLDPAEVVLKKNYRRNLADRRSKKNPLFTNDRHIEPQPVIKERQERHSPDRRSHAASALNIMILTTGAMKYGLVVDELLDSEEIVVKPLGCHLKNCSIYAGATIMGDGRVSLILDVINIARTLGLTSVEKSDRALELATELKNEPQQEKQPLLIFRNHPDQQFAIPLSQVQRIEKIKKQQIEEIGDKKAMQYRKGMLPLFSVDEVVAVKPLADQQDLLVLVLMLAGHEVGLLAASPVNSMEMSGEIDDRTHKQVGIIGSTLIGNTTTLIVNVYDIFQQLNPSWFAERTAPIFQDSREATILIVEDSTFFRNLVKDFLEAENYQVLEAADGHIALDILAKHHQDISLIISDIEMPNLDGLSMAKAIRSQPLYNRLPIIALTTLAGDKDIARGKEAGIDDYLIKMDKENLMAAIYRLLHKELSTISP